MTEATFVLLQVPPEALAPQDHDSTKTKPVTISLLSHLKWRASYSVGYKASLRLSALTPSHIPFMGVHLIGMCLRDEITCLAPLFCFNKDEMRDLLSVPDLIRKERFVDIQKEFPSDIFISSGKRMTEAGFTWCPIYFASENFVSDLQTPPGSKRLAVYSLLSPVYGSIISPAVF